MNMSNSGRIKVSVVMCTYNGGRYLRQQIDSILAQTYPVDELIVQDDCSTDDTVAIVREYAKIYPFIRVYVNERNMGYNANFLNAVFKAKGEAIAIADQDDIWKPTKLERQIELFDRGYSLVFHNSALFNKDPQKPFSNRHDGKPLLTEFRLLLKPFIPGHECLFTRQALPLMEKIVKREDNVAYAYVIALVCSALGSIAYVDEPLVLWRRHEKAATFAGRSDTGAFAGVLKSLLSVFNSRKRDVLKRYFAAVSVLPFDNKDTRQLVSLMQGGICGLFRACALCWRHTADLQHGTGMRSRIKALLTPLHLLREDKFLIK